MFASAPTGGPGTSEFGYTVGISIGESSPSIRALPYGDSLSIFVFRELGSFNCNR